MIGFGLRIDSMIGLCASDLVGQGQYLWFRCVGPTKAAKSQCQSEANIVDVVIVIAER